MKRARWGMGLFAAATVGAPAPALAHAFGQRYDLPVPLALYVFGAGAAVAVSFVVIGLFLGDVRWSRAYPRLDLLRLGAFRGLAHPACVGALRAVAVALFGLVLVAGFWGNQQPMANIAPVLVWILWWVGMAYVQAFVGDLWTVVNPWRTLFAWVEALFRRATGRDLTRNLPYPDALGTWPAVALLVAFAWAELVFPEPAVPRNIAWMVAAYSVVTWSGMALYGRERWLRHGEAFSVLFGVLARFAPTEIRVDDPAVCGACGLGCRDDDGHCVNCAACFAGAGDGRREWALRPFAVGLMRNETVSPSMTAFVVLFLATVLYDGVLTTPGWGRIEDHVLAVLALTGDGPRLGLRAVGLVGAWLLLLGFYLATCRAMAAAVGGGLPTRALAGRFVFALVPIGIAYHLAHYLSYLLIQGQYAVPLASDPLGLGWDLFGTAAYKVDIAVVGARFAWYLAVVAIVAGHVIAVYLAHVAAMTRFGARRQALRSQVPMTALMIAFTVTSLTILAEPIVQRPAAATEIAATPEAAVPVPGDAVRPEPGSGMLKAVGPGRTARAGLRYGAMASIFHDGTAFAPADIAYAFAFAYRWGSKGAARAPGYDPAVDRATALMRDRLVGVRFVGIDKSSKSIRVGDFAFIRELVLVEVYLARSPATPEAAAAIAPPWSSVPWHVLALMEDAVGRGWAAFSKAGADAAGVPWLDLARPSPVMEMMAARVDAFAADGFRPAPIRDLVTSDEARKRWTALKAFYAENGHFLVTDGPYRLAAWEGDVAVLKVMRHITYPLGVGSYDSYAIPRRARITGAETSEAGLRLTVEVEQVEKFMRSHRIVRETLTHADGPAMKGQRLECRYVVVGADGRVRLAGAGRLGEDGRITVDVAGRLAPGDYTVLAAVYLNGNLVDPEIREIPYRAP